MCAALIGLARDQGEVLAHLGRYSYQDESVRLAYVTTLHAKDICDAGTETARHQALQLGCCDVSSLHSVGC